MKHILLSIAFGLLANVADAAPLSAKRVQEELGASLGFEIYRFEAKLGSGEVLVIREVTEDKGKVTEAEYAVVGDQAAAVYEIVLVDSGAFHPSLRNTYMLRYPNANGYIEKMRLSQWGSMPDGAVQFMFSEVDSNVVSRKLTWVGSVEKYAEVVKRWPELPKPMAGGSSGSRHLVRKG